MSGPTDRAAAPILCATATAHTSAEWLPPFTHPFLYPPRLSPRPNPSSRLARVSLRPSANAQYAVPRFLAVPLAVVSPMIPVFGSLADRHAHPARGAAAVWVCPDGHWLAECARGVKGGV